MFFKQIGAGGDRNFAYIVADGESREAAVFDPGMEPGRILDIIGREGFTLKYIINTHDHFDHIGGNHDIKEATGTEILCHPLEREAIEKLNEYSLYTMAQQWGLEFKAVSIDGTVEDCDIIQVGDVKLEVVHNPGHTPGCISFMLEEDGVKSLICGDIAGASGRLGYINGPGFVLDDWKKSIKKLVEISPQRLYPGHGTFLLADAPSHLKLYDQKMNAAWTTIITEVG